MNSILSYFTGKLHFLIRLKFYTLLLYFLTILSIYTGKLYFLAILDIYTQPPYFKVILSNYSCPLHFPTILNSYTFRLYLTTTLKHHPLTYPRYNNLALRIRCVRYRTRSHNSELPLHFTSSSYAHIVRSSYSSYAPYITLRYS